MPSILHRKSWFLVCLKANEVWISWFRLSVVALWYREFGFQRGDKRRRGPHGLPFYGLPIYGLLLDDCGLNLKRKGPKGPVDDALLNGGACVQKTSKKPSLKQRLGTQLYFCPIKRS